SNGYSTRKSSHGIPTIFGTYFQTCGSQALGLRSVSQRWSRNWKSSCWEQARFSQPSSSTRERKHDAYHVRSSCRELTQHTLEPLILLVQNSFWIYTSSQNRDNF